MCEYNFEINYLIAANHQFLDFQFSYLGICMYALLEKNKEPFVVHDSGYNKPGYNQQIFKVPWRLL